MASETDEARTSRAWAGRLFHDVWAELDRADRTPAADDRMVHMEPD